MQTDSLFYKLFQTAPSLLFELIDYPSLTADAYVFRSVELKQTAFRIDGVFLPESETADAPIFLVEVQFQRDGQLYARLFSEMMLFLRQNPTVQDWHMVVMYGDRTCEPNELGAHAGLVNAGFVQRLYLDELAQSEGESIELGLVRLVVEPPERAIAQAQRLATRVDESSAVLSASAIIEMIETILVYKFPQMGWQEIRAMFGLSELKQTRVYQEGREEGREEGERSLVLRQLKRRLGSLPDTIEPTLAQLSVDSLEALGEALLDFSEVDDLTMWLQEHSPNN